jgi:hypothetical protein
LRAAENAFVQGQDFVELAMLLYGCMRSHRIIQERSCESADIAADNMEAA